VPQPVTSASVGVGNKRVSSMDVHSVDGDGAEGEKT
jgi:hypothetical protein